MPNVSGSPTQIATSVKALAELSGTIADEFESGDQGFVASELITSHGPLYVLVRSFDGAASFPVNGSTVVGVFQQPGDRWVSLSLLGGGGTGFSRTFYCDPLTTTPLAAQDGSVERPYATVAQGITRAIAVGGNCSLVLTSGVYAESVVIPPGAVLDRLDIVGMGCESTRIIAPPGSPAFAWTPSGPLSPCSRMRLANLSLEASGGAYGLDMDGTNVLGVFFGDLSMSVTPMTEGLQIEECLVVNARLVKTGIANFVGSDIQQSADLSVTQFCVFENTVLSLTHMSSFAGANGAPSSEVVIRHNDVMALRFVTLLMFAGSKAIDGSKLILDGFPGFEMDPSCFFDTILDGTGITASSNPLLVYMLGQAGFIGGAPIVVVFPDSTPGPPDFFGTPVFLAPEALCGGSVDLSHPVGTDVPFVLFRGAKFLQDGPSSIKFSGIMTVDLTGAAFTQQALDPDPTAQVLRDSVRYLHQYANGPGDVPPNTNTFLILPQFPPGTTYTVIATPSDGNFYEVSSPFGTRTNTQFDLNNNRPAMPASDAVDIEVRPTP